VAGRRTRGSGPGTATPWGVGGGRRHGPRKRGAESKAEAQERGPEATLDCRPQGPGGFSPFYRPEPLSSGPEVRMYHLRGSLTRNTNLQIQVLGNASEAVTLNRPKRHHVTPESYLNNFASLAPAQKSPRLSVLIRRTGVIEHQVKTKDIFYRHFYDHLGPDGRLHGSAEKPLNTEVEEPGNKVIASLLDGKAITYPQTRHLARYLMLAIVRSLWFHICLRAVLVEHSKRHGYDAEVVPELTQRKQVELLRAFMGLPTDSPNVYRDDPILSKVFNPAGSPQIENSKWTTQTWIGGHLHYRQLTIFTAPKGNEFITGDNYVIPLQKESVDDVLAVPLQNSTELLMPLSPNKLLFASGRTSRSPGVSISRKSLPADQVKNVNDIVCTFASAHIFSSNEELLKEVHDRNPFFDGKIVVVGGSEYSYFPYPPELPQKFLQ
jgi:hypothetical protein